MRKFFSSLILAGLLTIPSSTFSQTTGSFDINITFQGQPRQLSLFVPNNYNASTPYRLMVCLHGLGDNSVNYRNALINSLSWGTNIPNTIFVCPEAAATTTDYFSPAGGEAIIQESIDYARQNYNIDTTDIVLQGFSLGGRAALRYGLDNYSTFKGLLLNTPAVQGVKEAVNGSSLYPFNYQNASNIPIYITWGTADILYEAPIDSSFEQLVLNDGKVKYLPIAGIGHTIPLMPQLGDFPGFFNNPPTNGLDLDVVKINAPLRSCSQQIAGTDVLVRNTGIDTIHTVALDYTINNATQTQTWNGTLAPFQHALISLPSLSASVGNAQLNVSVNMLENNLADTFVNNNSASDSIIVQTQGLNLPFTEDFENANFPGANWILNPAGDIYSEWAWDNTVSNTGAASISAFNTIFIFDNKDRKDDISTPLLNLSSLSSPFLAFDVAYNFHRYTPPYFTANTDFADTLEVLISTDCGHSFTSLYKKGGADLATFSQPIINPLSIAADFIDPADSNWKTEYIDLSNYASSTSATLVFRYISALGGCINIDNVRVSNALSVSHINPESMIRVYPNPASDRINVTSASDVAEVQMIDVSGKVVLSYRNENHNEKITLNTSPLAEGVYILRLTADKYTTSRRVLIRK
ncbi:MAG TPA: T9SS type A sorting domain-containing protein [Flavipsychrobacter sp.]|nr:T9SS type A sorting domain-containing protein [Flavipsychrobacter sp.]